MEKNFGSWFYHDQQSRNQKSLGSPVHTGPPSAVPAYMNRYSEYSTFGTSPPFLGSGMQHKASEPNVFRNSLHFLPFHQTFAPVPNPVSTERLPTTPLENFRAKGSPDTATRTAQKKFLVFDQSGGKTTLIYSSGVETPVQCMTLSRPKPPATYILNKEARNPRAPLCLLMNDEYNENNYKHDKKSEMHEDTEELNALLFSDGDSESSEDDEETSTDRSPPSTMTHCRVPVSVDDGCGLRSTEPTKRQKLLHGGYDLPPLMHTARSLKTYTSSELEDDAESSCGKADSRDFKEFGTVSGKKRYRKDEVLETVNILQRIVPGGKGKDAIVIIDKAIHYLRSLKAEAKASIITAPLRQLAKSERVRARRHLFCILPQVEIGKRVEKYLEASLKSFCSD